MIMTVPVEHQIRTRWLHFHIPERPPGRWLFSISTLCLILTVHTQDFQNLDIAMEVVVLAASTVKVSLYENILETPYQQVSKMLVMVLNTVVGNYKS